MVLKPSLVVADEPGFMPGVSESSG